MKKILLPYLHEWPSLTKRPKLESHDLYALVQEVFAAVQLDGDKAVAAYSKKFDKAKLKNFMVSEAEMQEAGSQISNELKSAIGLAKANIEKFHQSQILPLKQVETTEGVTCWRDNRAIENVGIYVPGGSAPLFSTVLMLGIPAQIAGCGNVVLCTPPNANGEIHPAILYAASQVGITSIFKVGGIQAIAALTFGTKSIPKVDKIFGPGNQYVTAAKQAALQYGLAIDMPAGPSEVLIIADKSCNPAFVAADLLSQAEHGADSQVILLSDTEEVLDACMAELQAQVKLLPRQAIAEGALANSRAIQLPSIVDCLEFSNLYAPEHLILAIENAFKLTPQIRNAGSVFIGNYSCESAGDYASGTNHTLPTNGYARSYSGVSVDSFVKKITFQLISKKGIQNIGPAIEVMAEAEQLFAHKNAVTLRLNHLNHV